MGRTGPRRAATIRLCPSPGGVAIFLHFDGQAMAFAQDFVAVPRPSPACGHCQERVRSLPRHLAFPLGLHPRVEGAQAPALVGFEPGARAVHRHDPVQAEHAEILA